MLFQDIVANLNKFWSENDCLIMQPYDTEKGAGTMNPSTFLRCIGPEPWAVAYTEPCRRPTDGRFGDNPNRAQHYFQYQVIIKPSPEGIQEKYLLSLENLGINIKNHDIRFVEDNWESPTLGAWGVGWGCRRFLGSQDGRSRVRKEAKGAPKTPPNITNPNTWKSRSICLVDVSELPKSGSIGPAE